MTPARTRRARARANAAAQAAFRRMVRHHIKTGEWDRHLVAEWHAAELVLDAIDEVDAPAPRGPRTPDAGDHFLWPVQ